MPALLPRVAYTYPYNLASEGLAVKRKISFLVRDTGGLLATGDGL
jgi:hypothetical protein